MRIGASVRNMGTFPARIGLTSAARVLEDVGFESLWCSDHIVMPTHVDSRYPFTADGRVPWRADSNWFEAIVTMTAMAAVTERCEIGAAVLVGALREPLLLAKQLATVDAISGGRTVLGLGAGWLAEEFSALGVDFASRGTRLDELMAVLSGAWAGKCEPYEGRFYIVPAGLNCFPVPLRRPPLLVGGMSKAALTRAGRIGDGWFARQPADAIDVDAISDGITVVREAAESAGRDPGQLRFVLSLSGSAGSAGVIAPSVSALARAGVTDLVVDALGRGDDDASACLTTLRDRLENCSGSASDSDDRCPLSNRPTPES